MPTDNVHVLRAERPVNADAVERLERALAMARDGVAAAIGIAIVLYDGAVVTMHSDADRAAPLLGAVDILHARMLRTLLEDDE